MQKQHEKNLHTLIFALFLGAALAAGLILAVRYDLQIDQALNGLWQKAVQQREQGKITGWYAWAVAAETLAPWPAYAPLPVLGWCLCAAARRIKKYRALRLVFGVALLGAGGIALSFSTFSELQKRESVAAGTQAQLAVGLAAAVLLFVWAWLAGTPKKRAQGRIGDGNLYRWTVLALFWAGMTLSQLAVIRFMKGIWQRTRFDDLLKAGDFSDFTTWLQVPGNGGNSFPSGHTASMGVILILVVACRLFEACRDDEAGFLFLGYGVTAATAFGRMLIGRHYLSDTLCAILVDSLLLALAWYLPPLSRLTLRCAKRAAALDAAAAASAVPEEPEKALAKEKNGAASQNTQTSAAQPSKKLAQERLIFRVGTTQPPLSCPEKKEESLPPKQQR